MLPAPNPALAVLRQPTDSMPQYYDSLEARDPKERERLLMAALSGQIAHAKRKAPGWARILADVDPAGVNSRAALAKLPVTRKSDLVERSEEHTSELQSHLNLVCRLLLEK